MVSLLCGAGIEGVSEYIAKHLPGETVASCEVMRFTAQDRRYYRTARIRVVIMVSDERLWRECLLQPVTICPGGTTASWNVPPLERAILVDRPEFRDDPGAIIEAPYFQPRPGDDVSGCELSQLVQAPRYALIILEFDCDLRVRQCEQS